LLTYLNPYIGIISPALQLAIIVFNILIYIISTKSNDSKLQKMDSELVNTEKVTH